MDYKVASIDIHKKLLIVAVATAADQVPDAIAEALEFECRRFGSGTQERQHLMAWLLQRGVQEVVMESTAQYWKPVWLDLEPHFPKLHLAQAQSNRAPKGRKDDYRDAKRLARRLLAGELMLSFVPEAEQRTWREAARAKEQYVAERVRVQNRIESQLEENAHQALQRDQRSAGCQRTADSDCSGQRTNRSGATRRTGGREAAVRSGETD